MRSCKVMHFKSFLAALLMILSCLFDVEATGIPETYTGSIASMAEYAKLNGQTTRDRLLIIQQWMSDNMVYDLAKRDEYENATSKRKLMGVAYLKATAAETLKRRSGVCEDFAALFASIAKAMDVNMYVVSGVSARGGSHAWCAAVIDDEPYLFDPTWASGHVSSNTYEKKLDTLYFMANPETFNHTPVDPLWQFSEHPLRYGQEKGQGKDNPYFNWRDTFKAFCSMDTVQKVESSLRRGVNNGNPTPEIATLLAFEGLFLTEARFHSIYDEWRVVREQIESGRGRWTKDNKTMSAIQNYENRISDCERILNRIKPMSKLYEKDVNQMLDYFGDLRNNIASTKEMLEKQNRKDAKESEKRQKKLQLFNF